MTIRDDDDQHSQPLGVGELTVVPPHGLAEVVAIATQTVHGSAETFYELVLKQNASRVWVPAHKLEALGLRPLIGPQDAARVLRVLGRRARRLTGPWPKLARALAEKINSGSIFAAAEVLRDLYLLKARQPLSTTSQRLLDAARALVVAELAHATGRSADEIEREVLARVDRGARLPCGLRRG